VEPLFGYYSSLFGEFLLANVACKCAVLVVHAEDWAIAGECWKLAHAAEKRKDDNE